jgi:hypothetical protein
MHLCFSILPVIFVYANQHILLNVAEDPNYTAEEMASSSLA